MIIDTGGNYEAFKVVMNEVAERQGVFYRQDEDDFRVWAILAVGGVMVTVTVPNATKPEDFDVEFNDAVEVGVNLQITG